MSNSASNDPQPDLAVEAESAFNAEDFAKAFSLYMRLALEGDAEAQLFIGWMYETGSGVGKSPDDALRWYAKAAEQNHCPAWLYLASLLEEREKIEEALNAYKKASDCGSLLAMYRLGVKYKSFGTDPSFWLGQAAEKGHVFAIMQIGRLMYRRVLPGNKVRALCYMARAYYLAIKIALQVGAEEAPNDERLRKY